MYRQLEYEMDKKGYTLEGLAILLGLEEKVLREKMDGAIDFTWSEVLLVRRSVAPEMSLEELFEEEGGKKKNRTYVR